MHDSSNMIDKILTFIHINLRTVIYKNDFEVKNDKQHKTWLWIHTEIILSYACDKNQIDYH